MMNRKTINFANKMSKFLNSLSDVSKEWYLTEYTEIFVLLISFLNKLGLMHEFILDLDDPDKIFFNDITCFIQKIEKIRQEVLEE